MTTWSIGGSQGSYRPEEPSSMGAGNDTHGTMPGEGVEPPDNRSAVGHISRSVTRARLATNFESVFKVPVAGAPTEGLSARTAPTDVWRAPPPWRARSPPPPPPPAPAPPGGPPPGPPPPPP